MSEIIKQINVGGVDYDIMSNELTKITYAELKALRDNGELQEGHIYRITDYVTTTTETRTKSAGNVFDVIVLATSTSELLHIARAIQHEGDTYFDGNDLGAWELWYDLDNDTEKYAWADATNGKGVIYRMIDEKRNDCPYDFKNILFYTTEYTDGTTSDNYYYTFSYVVRGKLYDGTVEKQVGNCHSNSMRIYASDNYKRLNRNVFRNEGFDNICQSNTFGLGCCLNIFGARCSHNIFGNFCSYNIFGNNFRVNTFGHTCTHNTFGVDCERNIFGNFCSGNTFGRYVRDRQINNDKTSITLNDEYYDDGSGQLVPIKHPDLSTQPSILPYKFMGQYVYEQLIPFSGTSFITIPYVKNRIILSANAFIFGDIEFASTFTKQLPLGIPVGVRVAAESFPAAFGGPIFSFVLEFPDTVDISMSKGYIKITYTSIPEEGGYYGYNNY